MPNARLLELYAHGLGVIDDARVEFGPGFNVITGETGAGKTLLLGALDLCLGGDGAVTRHAVLSDMRAVAVFQTADDRETALSRESGPTGRLRSALDGVSSSAESLRALADGLIVIHGQHDSLALRSRADVLRILDESAGISTVELDDARRRLREARAERSQLGGDGATREREGEFLDYQITEIETAKIASADELHTSLRALTNLTELRDGQAALAEVIERLDGDGDDVVLADFARAIDRLPNGVAYERARTDLRGALDQARESVRELANLRDDEAMNPVTMEHFEERVAVLQAIARKYGGTLESALTVLEQLRSQRQFQLEAVTGLEALDREITQLESREQDLARAARRDRDFAAVGLTNAVRTQLPRVALPNASLRFDVDGDDGADVRILFTPNPGLAEGPLEALASGGELSRVLLALSLETVHEDVVAVFDEVDAGVGGQVAQQIGDCLAELGRQQQVLAVTHLASVAARADHHIVIEKRVDGGATKTLVRVVEGADRVREIARMLAGDDLTAESQALARQLLETSREYGGIDEGVR